MNITINLKNTQANQAMLLKTLSSFNEGDEAAWTYLEAGLFVMSYDHEEQELHLPELDELDDTEEDAPEEDTVLAFVSDTGHKGHLKFKETYSHSICGIRLAHSGDPIEMPRSEVCANCRKWKSGRG